MTTDRPDRPEGHRLAPRDAPPGPGAATAPPPQHVRRARTAVAVLFFTNGALFCTVLPRYPEIKAALDLDNTQFGLSVAAFPLGALIAGLTAGALIRRFGSPATAVAATVVTAGAMALVGVAPVGLVFAAALFLAGAMDSITDVAQNSHGLRVQKLYGRSILNSFHAVWSIGAVSGGLLGALAAQLAVPLPLHLAVTSVVFAGAAVLSARWLLGGPEPTADAGDEPDAADGPTAAVPAATGPASHPTATGWGGRRFATWGVLVALVVVAASGAVVEDAGATWSALYLSGPLGATAFVAGTGFIALQGMQFVGRLLGDRLVDRFGQRAVARTGGLVVLVGTGAALAVPTVAGTVIGFGLAGLGVATLIPAAMHGADELPGLRPGTGLTVLSWLLRVGFLVSPPVVGAVADASSLRLGLLVMPLVGLLVVLFAGVLAGRVPHAGGEGQTQGGGTGPAVGVADGAAGKG